jgi:membrane associated rhomboid family serine protease
LQKFAVAGSFFEHRVDGPGTVAAVIPLKDYNPTRRFSFVTLLLIIACVVVYFFVQNRNPVAAVQGPRTSMELSAQTRFEFDHAAIPCEIVTGEPLSSDEILHQTCVKGDDHSVFPNKNVWLAALFSMFMHANLLHIGGNMLFLWIFGNNIEDTVGPFKYLAFYVAAGIVAMVTHLAVNPHSTVPVVGASGAIAGVMGAYLVLFPRVRIRTLIIFFLAFLRDIEARWLLGFWFVSQFFVNPSSGVAWAAHVGGFVFGVAVGLVWRARRRPVVITPAYA